MKSLIAIILLMAHISAAAEITITDEVSNQALAEVSAKFAMDTETVIKLFSISSVGVSNWAAQLKLKSKEKISVALTQAIKKYYPNRKISSTSVKQLANVSSQNLQEYILLAAKNLPEDKWDDDLLESYQQVANGLVAMSGYNNQFKFYFVNSKSDQGPISELAVFNTHTQEIKVFGTFAGENQ